MHYHARPLPIRTRGQREPGNDYAQQRDAPEQKPAIAKDWPRRGPGCGFGLPRRRYGAMLHGNRHLLG